MVVGDKLHGSEAWNVEERQKLRTALLAAGNPECILQKVLERCEACSGACGIEFAIDGSAVGCAGLVGAFCGAEVVTMVLEEIINKVCCV